MDARLPRQDTTQCGADNLLVANVSTQPVGVDVPVVMVPAVSVPTTDGLVPQLAWWRVGQGPGTVGGAGGGSISAWKKNDRMGIRRDVWQRGRGVRQ